MRATKAVSPREMAARRILEGLASKRPPVAYPSFDRFGWSPARGVTVVHVEPTSELWVVNQTNGAVMLIQLDDMSTDMIRVPLQALPNIE